MADAAMALSDPSGGAEEAEAEEDACRICHLPAEAERPLRHPCACRGTIRFVHDDCLLRWLATRRTSPSRCEVCKHIISVAPVYAPNAPARLPLPEFMLGLVNKLMGWLFLLLSLLFAICVWEFVMPLTTVWVWRLALSRTFAQMCHLLSLRFSVFPGFHGLRFMPSPDTVLACVSIRRAFLRELPNLRQLIAPVRIAADALAPFALWIARIEAHLQARFGGLDSLQVLALHTVEAALIVVIGDVVFAFALGFLPFSMGRIVLWCISCFSFGNMDVDRSYASTASILLIGYGLIFSLSLLFTGLHTFQQYSRGEHLTIAIFFKVLLNCVHWLFTPFRLLPDIHVIVDRTFTFSTHSILWLISLANSSLNLTLILVICPLFFGWSLDISTSKLFGVTIPQKLKLLFGSSYASNALHWVVGCICLKLWPLLSSFLRSVPSLRASIPFVHSAGGQINISSIGKPFYKFYFMMLLDLLYNIIYVTMFILLPVEVVFLLVPTVFPLDVTYFSPPTQGTTLWQSPRSYAELLSGFLLLRFLICNTLKCLEPGAFVEKVLRYWFAIAGRVLGLSEYLIAQADMFGESTIGNSTTPKDRYVRPNEAKEERRYFAIRMTLLMVVAWLTIIILNSTLLVAPVSVGRALLSAIPQISVAGALKSNDLFAFAVGFCIISTIIAASRALFTYTIYGRRHLLASIICNWCGPAFKCAPVLFIWIVIIPSLIGLLVDCLLISPFVVSTNEVPVLDFFSIWFLGTHLLKFWTKLVHWTRVVPFLAYFIDERWDQKLTQAWQDGFSGLRAMWIMQDVLMPISVKLLSALCVPYVLAKGVFPTFGYSAAVNSTVHRFAWLGSLAVCVLYHLGTFFYRFFVKLHNSIRDERYLIGQRLEDFADNR